MNHENSFYAECWVFDCIQSQERNGKIAVQCYEFIFMSADYENLIKDKFEVCDWNWQDEHKDQSFWAIVKNYISETTSFKTNMIWKMKKNILKLNRMNVYMMNIWALNYKHDLVMNFSALQTQPHFMIWQRVISIIQIDHRLKLNQVYFDEMIDETNKEDVICSWIWILFSYFYMKRLHSWDSMKNRSVKVSRSILNDNSDKIKWSNNLTLWQRSQEKTSKIICSDVRNQNTVHSLSKKQNSLTVILKNQSHLKKSWSQSVFKQRKNQLCQ